MTKCRQIELCCNSVNRGDVIVLDASELFGMDDPLYAHRGLLISCNKQTEPHVRAMGTCLGVGGEGALV